MGEWISVEDRLPEIKGNHVSDAVLVYCAKQRVTALSELEETFFGGFVFDIERCDEDAKFLKKVLEAMIEEG